MSAAANGWPGASVCLAMRPELLAVVREAIVRARPDARVCSADDAAAAGADILLVAPHELGPGELAGLVAMHPWRWIHSSSAGYDFFDGIDVSEDMPLTRSAQCYAAPLAEYTALALLSVARPGAPPWQPGGGYLPSEDVGLFGQALGVAGYGAVGRSVAALGRALGMEVTVLSQRPRGPGELPSGVAGTTTALALREMDALVLALPLTAATRELFGEAFFGACKPGLHVVNVARGALIDHAALARAVATRGVRATLDVTEPEPLPAGHPLRRAKGVRLSPHVAWHSRASDSSFVRDFLDNWSRWESGRSLDGLVRRSHRGTVA